MTEWKEIQGFNDKYLVSDDGKVWSKLNSCEISINPGSRGYQIVTLFENGKRYTRYVHRLVAIAFLGYKKGLVVNHIDGNKQNNNLYNLEWITQSENMIHSFFDIENGNTALRGNRLTKIEIESIKKDYYDNKIAVRDIQKKYKIGSTTLYRIVDKNRRKTKRKPKKFTLEKDEVVVEIKDMPLYYISNFGNVYSAKSGRKLTPVKDVGGYFCIKLFNEVQHSFSIHRLVAQHFIENKENKRVVNHINHIITDNRVENLEWTTHKENSNR